MKFLDPVKEIWSAALHLGLNPHPVHFEFVPYHVLYEVGSYGLPGHYHHWTFGRNYWIQKMRYEHGESKIYELVINADPALAYLLQNNSEVQNAFVMAHVMGHAHMFKVNEYWKDTKKDMPQYMAAASGRFAEYEQVYGAQEMEDLITRGLALQFHVEDEEHEPVREMRRTERKTVYDELFRLANEETRRETENGRKNYPREGALIKLPHPTEDLLGYIIRYSPVLSDYQRDVLSVIRREGIYRKPFYCTKLLHEGFAVWTHQHILNMLDLSQEERVEAAITHAGVAVPYPLGINPYYLGWKTLDAIEREKGQQEVIRIAAEENDSSLIRNHLTEEMVEELDLYKWVKKNAGLKEQWEVGEKDWVAVKNTLADRLASPPLPRIEIYREAKNRGDLILRQIGDEDMDERYARETLNYCRDLWGGGVELTCRVNGRIKVMWSQMKD